MTDPSDRDEPATGSQPPVPDPALLEELSQAFDPTAETVRRSPRPTDDEPAPADDEPAPGGDRSGPAAHPPEAGSSAGSSDGAASEGADDRVGADEDDPADATGDDPGDEPASDGTADEPDVDATADDGDRAGDDDGATADRSVPPAAGDDESAEGPLAPVLPIGEPRLVNRTDEEDDAREAPDGVGDDGTGARTIRIGADEELPDAAYLDDELQREPSGEGTVFIDDDDSSDALATQDATGRGIEPRIRQRRIGVARAAGLRRLKWVIVAAAVLVVVIGALAFFASPVFDIDEVHVTGDQYTDQDQLQIVVNDLLGTPILLADTSAAEEQLEAIPWVESARVSIDFPNRVDIEIRERRPVAAMPGADGRTRVLDREGRILDVIDGQPIALVWIAGPITLDQPAGEFAPVGPASGASLVTKLTPTVRRRLDSMLVTPDGSDLKLMLRPLTEADADGDGVRDDAADEPAEDAGADSGPDASTTLPPVAPGSGGPLIEVRFGSAIGDAQQIEKLVRLERVLDDLGTDPATVIDVSTAEVTIQ